MDQEVHAALAKSGAPSASVAIVRGGQVVFAKAYGRRSIGPALPATISARYRIGSVSKQITATALLILAEEGRLSLDDKVARWLPELTDANQITVRQVLSHTAGYPGYFTAEVLPLEGFRPVEPQAIADRWGRKPLDYSPGTEWRYSNTDYVIAGLIVEKVSGEPLGDFIERRMFEPLKITSAKNLAAKPMPSTDAAGYTRFALGPLRPALIPGSGWEFGAGDWSMTAKDLARWDVGVIRHSLMSADSYEIQQTPAPLKNGKAAPYGLGVFVDTVAGHRRVQHPGWDAGFLTENRIYPDDRSAVAVMVNADFGAAQVDIADAAERMLIPQITTPKPKSRAPRQAVKDEIRPEEIALAHRLYDQLRRGELDRTALTADANAYFSAAALADYGQSLSRLGHPRTFVRLKSLEADGLRASLFVLTWPKQTLALVVRTDQQGKVASLNIWQPE